MLRAGRFNRPIRSRNKIWNDGNSRNTKAHFEFEGKCTDERDTCNGTVVAMLSIVSDIDILRSSFPAGGRQHAPLPLTC